MPDTWNRSVKPAHSAGHVEPERQAGHMKNGQSVNRAVE